MATPSFFPELPPRIGERADGSEYWPDSDNPYYKLNRYWLEAAYEEAKQQNSGSEEVREVQKFIDYLNGKQWPGGRPSYKSKPIYNKLWPIFWELISLLTDLRPIYGVRPLNPQYKHQAEIVNKVTQSWWMYSDADMALAMIIIYAMLGTGYGKLTWNSNLRNREGDFELIPLGMSDVLPLGARHSLNGAQAIIYQSVMPLSFFRMKFPVRGALVKPDSRYSTFDIEPARPAQITPLMYDMLSPAMRRVVGGPGYIGPSAFPKALYREFWMNDFTYNTSKNTVTVGNYDEPWKYEVPPGQLLFPRGRLIIMGGDIIVYDGPNPYWHGKFPFAAMRMNVVPWQFTGMSEMRSLMGLQDISNNILAGIMDAVKKATNPAFMASRGAFSDNVLSTIDWSMPGAKAVFSPVSPHVPTFAPPPNLPPFVLQTFQVVDREFDRSSGIGAMSDALKKKQVPSGDTLDQIKQAQQTPIRLKGRNVEVFLRQIGEMSIPNIFQFYTRKRRVMMLGVEGETQEDFDWNPDTMVPAGIKPEEHVLNFAFYIEPDTLLSAKKWEHAMLLLNLRKMHDIDRKTLFKGLQMTENVDEVEANLKKEAEEGIPGMTPKGRQQQKPPKPPTGAPTPR